MTTLHRFITNSELKRVGISRTKLAKLFNETDERRRTKADIEKTGIWITLTNED